MKYIVFSSMAKKKKIPLTREEKNARVDKLLESKELLPNGLEMFEKVLKGSVNTRPEKGKKGPNKYR